MKDVERTPLSWPSVQVRVRVQDQKASAAWKKSWRDYMSALDKEFHRMGVSRYVITYNDPVQSRDPGVAVWFTRKHEENYKWQDVLGIESPYPTVDEITTAYKRLAPKYHPDRNPGIDPTKFAELEKARQDAIAFVRGTDALTHDMVIACDGYKEQRLNLFAIVGTIHSLRMIQKYGSGQLYEQAFHAFQALPEHKPVEVEAVK